MTINDFDKRKKLNSGADRIIDNWEIIDVHDLGFSELTEADFYCCDGSKVVLLRIRVDMEGQKISINNNGEIPYWIAQIEDSTIDNTLLKKLLTFFSDAES